MKIRRKNIKYIGKKFGKLTVIEDSGQRKIRLNGGSYTIYNCLCECGNYKKVSSINLRRKDTKSCGCLAISRRTGYKELSGTYVKDVKKSAKRRNKICNIDAKYMYEIWEKQNKKCAISGIELKFSTTTRSWDGTASLDRIDSSKGYVKGNVQWIHKDINKMKMDLGEKRFIDLCKIIANYKS